MKSLENCYFWIDESEGKENSSIKTICEKCHKEKEKYKELGWFWEGSKLGYGPFDFICCDAECQHVIYSPGKVENEKK